MSEFSLIRQYFKSIAYQREDVLLGIGDDAACLHVPNGMELLVSTDTLVEGIHFLQKWDAYDIASRAVRVNVSDMAAMAATPSWATLALTMPTADEAWLKRFSQGLANTLNYYHVALVGGDTTKGPLSITITIHGLAPSGCFIKRSGAEIGDCIVVSGYLGAAAAAVSQLNQQTIDDVSLSILMDKLLHPEPRIDLMNCLRQYATAAIDISDGLAADLNHILEASHVGACLSLDAIPVHPLVCQYLSDRALDFALNGGDDYELCFTVPPSALSALDIAGFDYYCIGTIESAPGLRMKTPTGEVMPLEAKGYSHF
jgi:thiamine-monophosphate kinase